MNQYKKYNLKYIAVRKDIYDILMKIKHEQHLHNMTEVVAYLMEVRFVGK